MKYNFILFIFTLSLFPVVNKPVGGGTPIDLNIATAKEFQALPGIGPMLAERIISNREKNGPYRSPDDIMRVFGVGEKKFQAIKSLITVGIPDNFDRQCWNKNKINLNTATQVELETLPGIGPTKARRIIEYREKEGGFKRSEELMEVWGIGPRTYATLKSLVTVKIKTFEKASLKKHSASGFRTLKCWRCGKKFIMKSGVISGQCPFCATDWKIK